MCHAIRAGEFGLLGLGAAAVAVGAKEALFRVTRAAGEAAGSAVVVANARHHRADALSSAVAGAGVLGAWAGGAEVGGRK